MQSRICRRVCRTGAVNGRPANQPRCPGATGERQRKETPGHAVFARYRNSDSRGNGPKTNTSPFPRPALNPAGFHPKVSCQARIPKLDPLRAKFGPKRFSLPPCTAQKVNCRKAARSPSGWFSFGKAKENGGKSPASAPWAVIPHGTTPKKSPPEIPGGLFSALFTLRIRRPSSPAGHGP